MDPNANLEEQLRIATTLVAADETGAHLGRAALIDACRLAELVIALNDWLKGGGFLPKPWHVAWRKL